MNEGSSKRNVGSIVRTVAVGAGFTVIVLLLMLWLAGAFHPKIDPGRDSAKAASAPVRPVGNAELAVVRSVTLPRIEAAVGTVRAVHEASVASKLLAKVLEVKATAGQAVLRDEILVRLDDADLSARLRQAQAVEDAARAARDQARIEYDRVHALFERGSAAKIEHDRVETALKSAEAELDGSSQSVTEATAVLGYATIRAPISGVVIDKKVEPGDTVVPGQIVMTLYDSTRMQLVASVRESLTHRLAVGQEIGVRIDALDKACRGTVSEIVPEAQAASRTFEVKVTGPCPPGIYSGMFGRLLIPLDDESALVVARSAVRRVGQLDLVDVAEGGELRRRAVQLGRVMDGDLEVLAGLREGERVVVHSDRDGDGAGD